jgi:hypothetical protein
MLFEIFLSNIVMRIFLGVVLIKFYLIELLAPQENKHPSRNNSLEFISTNTNQVKVIETNKNLTEGISENTFDETPYWVIGEWSKTCRINPCSSNQTRSVKCSTEDLKCDQTAKPTETRPCLIQDELICKSKVNSMFNRVISFLEELFKSENIIE